MNAQGKLMLEGEMLEVETLGTARLRLVRRKEDALVSGGCVHSCRVRTRLVYRIEFVLQTLEDVLVNFTTISSML